MRFGFTRPSTRWLALVACFVLNLLACDRENEVVELAPYTGPTFPDMKPFGDMEARDLQSLLVGPQQVELGEATRFPECWQRLESDGDVVAALPFSDLEEFHIFLIGCEAEAFQRADRHMLVAWGSEEKNESRSRDLRVAAFDEEGKRIWHHTMLRTREGNYLANFRDSFIARTHAPDLVCAGTRWEGGTQTTCIRHPGGEVVFDGRIPVWSATPVIGLGDSLYLADLTGVSRRYPYTGVERKHHPLDGTGGRAGFHATTATSLFFVPGPSPTLDPRMVRFDFEGLQPVWRRELPVQPAPGWSATGHGLVMFRASDTIWALDQDSGAPLWGLQTGELRPLVASTPTKLYMYFPLLHRPHVLAQVEPETGDILKWGSVPGGVLSLATVGEDLYLRSVRSLQRLEGFGDSR